MFQRGLLQSFYLLQFVDQVDAIAATEIIPCRVSHQSVFLRRRKPHQIDELTLLVSTRTLHKPSAFISSYRDTLTGYIIHRLLQRLLVVPVGTDTNIERFSGPVSWKIEALSESHERPLGTTVRAWTSVSAERLHSNNLLNITLNGSLMFADVVGKDKYEMRQVHQFIWTQRSDIFLSRSKRTTEIPPLFALRKGWGCIREHHDALRRTL